jgi:hypothetical protein
MKEVSFLSLIKKLKLCWNFFFVDLEVVVKTTKEIERVLGKMVKPHLNL